MTTSIVGWRVFACDVCGAKFRFERTRTTNPYPEWPPVTYGTVVDVEGSKAMREHALTHGGTVDRRLAYTGPTTWSTYTEQLTADADNAP